MLKNKMIIAVFKNGVTFRTVIRSDMADTFKEQCIEHGFDTKMIDSGAMALEDLPADVQADVKETLTCFDWCTVDYKNGGFHVIAGCGISSSYPADHFYCGEYRADDIYTPEERREHRKALSGMIN